MSEWHETPLGIVGSAALGALGTLLVQAFLAYWHRPILHCEDNANGCLKDIYSPTGEVTSRHLRLKISNVGKSEARNVRASVEELVVRNAIGAVIARVDEVVPLGLTWSSECVGSHLPSNSHLFSGFACAQRCDPNDKLFIDSHPKLASIAQLDFSQPSYELTIRVSAENAKTIRFTSKWRWEGTLDSLKTSPRCL